MTKDESLLIIEKMMEKTKSRLLIRIALNSITAGYPIVVICLLNYILSFYHIKGTQYIWIVLPFLIPILLFILRRRYKYGDAISRDYTGISLLWKIIVIMMIFLTIFCYLHATNYSGIIFLFIVGIGHIYTNIVIKFRQGLILSIFGLAIGYIGDLVSWNYYISFCVAIIFMIIIPAHILLCRSHKKVL